MAFNHSALDKSFGPFHYAYDWKAPSLYALACGADADDLPWLLESLRVIPSFAVVPALAPMQQAIEALDGDVRALVHGAQRFRFHRTIPASGTLSTTAQIVGLYDKGRGATATYRTVTQSPDGETVFETEWDIFYRGEGGFGGERGPKMPRYRPPSDTAPDVVVSTPTAPTQALLYRLASGDLNPIHSDPSVAAAVGFDRPILHGLCTMGHATLALIKAVGDSDPARLQSLEGRFSRPVFPGDTLETRAWNMSATESYFAVHVPERNEDVITLGRATWAA